MMRRSAGYTILEAMIFLAVSGVLFALVVPAYNNQQDKIRFSQSARDMESKINDVINDVSAGYFPDEEVECSATAGGVSFTSGSATQGTREDCIFVGKNMIFSNLPDSTSQIDIDTYVGRRKLASGARVASLTEATPKAVNGVPTGPNLVEKYNLGPVMKIDCVYELPDPTSGGFCDTSPSSFKEIGAYISLSSINSTKTLDIITDHVFTTINPPKGIIICLRDTKTDQQAAILVGGEAGIAKTKLVFDKVNIDSTYGGGVCG